MCWSSLEVTGIDDSILISFPVEYLVLHSMFKRPCFPFMRCTYRFMCVPSPLPQTLTSTCKHTFSLMVQSRRAGCTTGPVTISHVLWELCHENVGWWIGWESVLSYPSANQDLCAYECVPLHVYIPMRMYACVYGYVCMGMCVCVGLFVCLCVWCVIVLVYGIKIILQVSNTPWLSHPLSTIFKSHFDNSIFVLRCRIYNVSNVHLVHTLRCIQCTEIPVKYFCISVCTIPIHQRTLLNSTTTWKL